MSLVSLALVALSISLLILFSRFTWVTPWPAERSQERTLAVFLGSGGHTAEMLRLVKPLPKEVYTTRRYLVSSGDVISLQKVQDFQSAVDSHSVTIIPRARRVHQSFFTAPFTTLWSMMHCLFIISIFPYFCHGMPYADVVLLNGPGSCVPIALSAFLPRIFFLPHPKIIYVESIARITSLSLSGKILRKLRIVDELWVQWEELALNLNQDKSQMRVLCDGWLI